MVCWRNGFACKEAGVLYVDSGVIWWGDGFVFCETAVSCCVGGLVFCHGVVS